LGFSFKKNGERDACPLSPFFVGSPENSREGSYFCSLFLLLRGQKKKQEKGTPASPGPAGYPYFSTGAAGQMGERKIPSVRSRAPEKLPKREVALFERSEFATSRQF
jgi:hypothetical protein